MLPVLFLIQCICVHLHAFAFACIRLHWMRLTPDGKHRGRRCIIWSPSKDLLLLVPSLAIGDLNLARPVLTIVRFLDDECTWRLACRHHLDFDGLDVLGCSKLLPNPLILRGGTSKPVCPILAVESLRVRILLDQRNASICAFCCHVSFIPELLTHGRFFSPCHGLVRLGALRFLGLDLLFGASVIWLCLRHFGGRADRCAARGRFCGPAIREEGKVFDRPLQFSLRRPDG